jgi:hypothetical protein
MATGGRTDYDPVRYSRWFGVAPRAHAGAWDMRLIFAIMLALCAAISPAAAEDGEKVFSVGTWEGFRLMEGQQFSHCAAFTMPNADDALILAIDRNGDLAISIAMGDWRHTRGATLMASVVIDGIQIANEVSVIDKRSVAINYRDDEQAEEAYKLLAKNGVLTIRTPSGAATFSLAGADRALAALVQCGQESMAMESGGSPASKAMRMDRAEVMVYVVNLLAKAGLTGQTYLAPADFEEILPGYDVAWRNEDGTVSGATIFTNAVPADMELVSSRIVGNDAAICTDNFASGVTKSQASDSTMTKELFTSCGSGSGTIDAHYALYVSQEGILFATATIALSAGNKENVEETGNALALGLQRSF